MIVKTKIIKVDGIELYINEVKSTELGEYQIKCTAISQKDKLLCLALDYIDKYAMSLNIEQRELLHDIENIRKLLLPRK